MSWSPCHHTNWSSWGPRCLLCHKDKAQDKGGFGTKCHHDCLSQCLYGISKFILDLECTSLDVNFRASNSFGSDLFSQLWSDRRTGANILLSPQSIFSALSLLHLGARQSPPLSLVDLPVRNCVLIGCDISEVEWLTLGPGRTRGHNWRKYFISPGRSPVVRSTGRSRCCWRFSRNSRTSQTGALLWSPTLKSS